MDAGEKNSSLPQGSPVEDSWARVTPAKPGFRSPDWKVNGNRIQLNKVSREQTECLIEEHQIKLKSSTVPTCVQTSSSVSRGSFSCWETDLGPKSQLFGIHNFPMGNVEMWNSIPCSDLLALADAAAATKCSGGIGSGGVGPEINKQFGDQESLFGTNFHTGTRTVPDTLQYGPNHSRYLFDLNSPPGTVTEEELTTDLSSEFAPVTPGQKRRHKTVAPNIAASNLDRKTNQAADKQNHERSKLGKQPQQILEQAQAAITTDISDNQNAEKGLIEETDLIKTPQPKQRRKKHRPKVVIEDKPRRVKKPTTPNLDGSSKVKRKYVRKNRTDKSTSTPTLEEEIETKDDTSTVRITRSSCRRKINFDEETPCTKEQDLNKGVESTVQPGPGTEVMAENTEMELMFDKASSTNEVAESHTRPLESQTQSPITPSKTEPPKDAKRSYSRAKCHINFSHETHDKDASSIQSPNESNCCTSACFNKVQEASGSKRECSSKVDGIEVQSQDVIEAHDDPVEAYLSAFTDYNSSCIQGLHFPVICKRKRTDKCHSSATSSTISSVWSAQDYSSSFPAAPNASKAPETPMVQGIKDDQHSYRCMLALGHMENFRRKRTKVLTRVRDLASFAGIIEGNQWQNFKGVTGYEASYQQHTCMEALAADFRVSIATKKRTKRNSTMPSYLYHNHQILTQHIGFYPGSRSKSVYGIDALVNQFKCLDINSRMAEQDRSALIPYLTRYQEKNALVLYQRDGSLVPYDGFFTPERRRKPRPKVDLDDETTRVWRLLLEDINSQGIDGTDEQKAKWWEEERRVFRGRADSFIARMHLVQGDRRFSRWKGSVVDSVIGVFLTQNVSDHLSSSAFMSLAARYPLKSKSSNEPLKEDTTSISLQEPCQADLKETIKWHEEQSKQLARKHDYMMLQETDSREEKEALNSNEFSKTNAIIVGLKGKSDCEGLEVSGNDLAMYKKSAADTSPTNISATVASFTGDEREIDDLVSSQNSIDTPTNSGQSSIAHTAERLGSSSISSSTEPLIVRSTSNIPGGTSLELLQMQSSTGPHGVYGEEKSNESCSKKIVQDKLERMAYSQEENEGISHGCNSSSGLLISPTDSILQTAPGRRAPDDEYFELREGRNGFQKTSEDKCTSEQSGISAESSSQNTVQIIRIKSSQEAPKSCIILQAEVQETLHSRTMAEMPKDDIRQHTCENNSEVLRVLDTTNISAEISEVTESNNIVENSRETAHKVVESNFKDHGNLQTTANGMDEGTSKTKRGKNGKVNIEWDCLRKQAQVNRTREKTADTMDSLDYEALRCADVNEIADTIKERGMNNMLAERIQDFLNRLVRDHGSIDLEWLRDVPPDKAKEYLLSFRGLGLKSVECVRLLTLHHLAFPVDTNVGRIAVRLGWVPLQPLPESLQLHLLELYPVLESIQKYLWPRLCKLDQRTLYELHYQMITFGKVFCTKNKPNCNACPMRGECRHFASAFASARLTLPAPEEKSIMSAKDNKTFGENSSGVINQKHLTLPPSIQQMQQQSDIQNSDPVIEAPATLEPIIEVPATPEPIVEVPRTPEPEHMQHQEFDIEDFCEDPEEIPTIKLNIEEFTQNLQTYMERNMELGAGEMSKALVALTPEAASIPTPKLKNVSQLRTEHHVYELPDSHPLLEGMDKREPDDPCSYLLAIWTPGETPDSIQPPGGQCSSQESGRLCNKETCFSCNSIREANSQTVRGTLLIPCRTAMRGSFPLNGTYFQVNEVFADHDSSLNPIDVPRSLLWNLPRRTVYFGTSIPTIFKGLTTEDIQYCFWRGFVCVRGFDQKTRAPRPLMARLHFPASKLKRSRGNGDGK